MLAVVVSPAAIAVVILGFIAKDCFLVTGHSFLSDGLSTFSAIKYGVLFAFFFIRYKSVEKNLRIDVDGFRMQTFSKVFGASQSPKQSEVPNASRVREGKSEVVASLPKSIWPPADVLGWTPFRSLPYGGGRSKGAQHYWTKGNSSMFNIRSVGYKQSKEKQPSEAPLYECIGVDLVRSNELISGISASCPVFKNILSGEAPGDIPYPWWRYKESKWSESLGIPRLLIINTQLPYSSPSLWSPQSTDSDPGFSIVSYYAISPSLAESLALGQGASEPPAVKLLKRLISEGKSSKEDTSLKTIGLVENMEDVGFPDIVSGYNGKPVLVTKSARLGFVPSKESCEILEIEFDVRLWSILARKSLYSLREKLKDARCQIGMLIEGKSDDELPEQLLGCFGIHFLDMQEALEISL